MINATETITILNYTYDAEERRQKLIPTKIEPASVYHSIAVKSSGTQGGDNREEDITYKIRIPIYADQSGKQYISEAAYARLSAEEAEGYWTLQKGCYVVLGAISDGVEIETEEQMRDYDGEFITVTEYADNTRRGSSAVQHWRIGGA